VAYLLSNARRSAEARIQLLERTVRLSGVKKLDVPTDVQKAALHNCVFQLCAVLEDYLSGLVKAWYARLHSNTRPSTSYPPATITYLLVQKLEGRFKSHLMDADEPRTIRKVSSEESYIRSLLVDRPMQSQHIGPAIVSGRKFPSPDNIKILSSRIGKPGLSGRLSARLGVDFEIALQAFLDVRNAIAHEFPPDVTQEDARRYIADVRRWLNAIDREMCTHICATSTIADWPT
jgi:hypothetical protein